MAADVIIKANSQGIVVVSDSTLSYDSMVSAVKNKFRQCTAIFKDSCDMPVTVKGPNLTDEEYRELLEQLNCIEGIKTHFTEAKKEKTALPAKYISAPHIASFCKEEITTNDAIMPITELNIPGNYIFKGTIRSGEELSIKSSVIIMGNVEKNAAVISGGNIIVLGKLLGQAIAGKTKSTNRFIMALSMKPEYIQIGNISQTFSRQDNKKNASDEPVIAYRSGNTILLERLSPETNISQIY
ncbi:MAG: septum site-determining protein MinC [Coprococcus sp.]